MEREGDEMFDFMKVLTLRAVFRAEDAGNLPPYLGSTVRGILGHCFRKFVCDRQALKCFRCSERFDCAYVQNFASTGGEAGAVNPFAIHVLTQGKTTWEAGDVCVFELTLFGRSALQPGIYLDAIKSMEKEGWGAERLRFSFVRITDAESGRLIFAGDKMWIRNAQAHDIKICERNAGTAVIDFETPVRIVSGRKLFECLTFPMLVQFLSRRMALLAKAYGDGGPDWKEDELLLMAEDIQVVEEHWQDVNFSRYSVNQKQNRLELPSRIGWVMYEGNLGPFVPLLEAGKYFHVGKNATIGFGHYEAYYDR